MTNASEAMHHLRPGDGSQSNVAYTHERKFHPRYGWYYSCRFGQVEFAKIRFERDHRLRTARSSEAGMCAATMTISSAPSALAS